MESIFAKIALSFATILGVVSTPTYIQLNTASIAFDYKTGDEKPFYYLSVKNIGSQRERFDVSADVPWVFISREGSDSVNSVYIEREGVVNFVLDVRTEMVSDGSHSGRITVRAVDVYTYQDIESKTVDITFNKNFTPLEPTVTPGDLPLTPKDEPTGQAGPAPTITPSLTASPIVSPVQTAIPKPEPTKIRPQGTPTSLEPTVTSGDLPLTGQAPAETPAPQEKPVIEARPSSARTIIFDFWRFLRNTLWPF